MMTPGVHPNYSAVKDNVIGFSSSSFKNFFFTTNRNKKKTFLNVKKKQEKKLKSLKKGLTLLYPHCGHKFVSQIMGLVALI